MGNAQRIGLTLPQRHYHSINKAVQRKFGASIGEIAEHDPLGAFDALSFGMASVYSSKGRRELVHRTVDSDNNTKDSAVINRESDGDYAFSGAAHHAMSNVVETLVQRYLDSEDDFAIQTNRNPGRIGKLIGRQSIQEIVVVIPRQIEF